MRRLGDSLEASEAILRCSGWLANWLCWLAGWLAGSAGAEATETTYTPPSCAGWLAVWLAGWERGGASDGDDLYASELTYQQVHKNKQL